MTGFEYMEKVCPTTSRGKDPNREDVEDAFNDGIAEGYNQAKIKALEWLEETKKNLKRDKYMTKEHRAWAIDCFGLMISKIESL